MNTYQELTFLEEEESFLGKKKLVIELALEVATQMRPPATKIKIKALLSLFSGQPLPQPQPRSTCKSLDRFGPSYLKALDSLSEHFIGCGEVCMPVCF